MNKPKVTEISNRMFEVLEHNIIFQKKKGRTIILCSCQNSTKFIDNNFCYHKQLVLEYIYTSKLKNKINQLIEFYKLNKDKEFSSHLFLNELNKLKRI